LHTNVNQKSRGDRKKKQREADKRGDGQIEKAKLRGEAKTRRANQSARLG